MKKIMFSAVGLSLLLASCNPPSTSTVSSELPTIPYTPSPTPFVCPVSNGTTPLSVLLNRNTDILDRGTHVSKGLREQTDLPETIQDMLYSSKSILNNMYYGYSTVNLNALHETALGDFKKDFPNALNSYVLSDNWRMYSNLTDAQQSLVDDKMYNYIDGVKDEHTFYLNRAQTDADKNGSAPTPVLGINMALVPQQDGLILTAVRLDGPAWTAGLRRGDVILSINNKTLSRTAGLTDDAQYTAFRKVLSDAIKAGGDLVMSVKRAGKVTTVRATPAVLTGTNMPWGEVRTDNVGKQHYYLRIPTFSSVGPQRTKAVPMPIASRVNQLVAEAQAKGVDNIVVDLRGNGGGLLIEFVGAAAAFAPKVAGESTRYLDGSSLNFAFDNGNVVIEDGCKQFSEKLPVQNVTQWKGKVAVLVDGDSASASEMFSANLRAAGVKVIGTQTVGVGNTSTYHFDLPAGRSMSVTAGRVFIDGQAAKQFITPDIDSKDDFALLADSGVDNTLQKAYDLLNK